MAESQETSYERKRLEQEEARLEECREEVVQAARHMAYQPVASGAEQRLQRAVWRYDGQVDQVRYRRKRFADEWLKDLTGQRPAEYDTEEGGTP